MKRSRILLSTLAAASFAGLAFTACDKKPDASAPPATPDSKPGTPAVPAPGKPTAGAPAIQPVSAPVAPVAPAPAAEVAKIAANYGFVARLPKDVEGFSSVYRLHDFWVGLSNSKWAATLLELPFVKANPDLTKAREQWDSDQGKQGREIAEAVLGQEISVAMPAGFTERVKPWQELLGIYAKNIYPQMFWAQMSGKPVDPQQMQTLIRAAAPELVPALAKCDILPVVVAFKAGKIRPLVEEGAKQLKEMVSGTMPNAELTTFKLADKFDFDSISLTGQRMLVGVTVQQMELQLTELLGSEAEAKKTLQVLLAKRLEVAWGWVDDYLVLSFGPDHSHLKLAPSEADSALSIAAVGRRATQFAAKKPFGLSYTSKTFQDLFATKVEFAEFLKNGAEELQKQQLLKPDAVQTIIADAKRLEAKAQSLYTVVSDPSVQVDYWDAGLRSEAFGGVRMTGADSSKPLTFSPLTTISTLLFVNSRTNGAQSKASTDFMEEAVSTVWGWYEKFGRTMVPEEGRQGAAMVETTAIPMLKELWKHTRTLGKAFGDESAFLVDAAGPVPNVPNVPPFAAEGKIPRIAWVMELKDRAALGEAWTGYYTIIKQIAALVDFQELPEPTKKAEGDVELHFIQPPVPTDDLLPHVAISKDRWILSTSPSLTKDLVAKGSTPTGAPSAAHALVNFGAAYDFADVWLKVIDKNGSQFMPPEKLEEFQQARPIVDAVLKLARSVQSFEWRLSEEGGQKYQSMHLKIEDAK